MATELTTEQWTEILQDENITNDLDIKIFQALYSCDEHKAPASKIGRMLGHEGKYAASPINSEIGRYGKRIASHYEISLTRRSTGEDKYWDIFFKGWEEGDRFIWQLRPELIQALLKTDLTGDFSHAGDLDEAIESEIYEGHKKSVTVNKYERSTDARKDCIAHWKPICAVCEFDFEKMYGELGKGYIHVHHLVPLSQIGKSYEVDPVNDLRPVCPNCHAMIHKRKTPYSIEEMKKIIGK